MTEDATVQVSGETLDKLDTLKSAQTLQRKERKRVTLPELGPNLSLGFPDSATGKYQRAIEVRRWTLRKEKELGAYRKENPELNLGEYVSLVLSEMCTQLGPHNFDKKSMNDKERRLVLSQMWMGDVLGAYCWLRYKAMGPELQLRLPCPFHDYFFTWQGDLRTLEVHTAESLEDAMWDLRLREPFDVRGQQTEVLGLGPVRWSAIEQAELGRRVNPGAIKAVMIRASIHRVNGEEFPIAENELDEMGKLDLETHIAQVDANSLGPDMRIEARCNSKRCERSFETSIDWSYDNFFAVSSR